MKKEKHQRVGLLELFCFSFIFIAFFVSTYCFINLWVSEEIFFGFSLFYYHIFILVMAGLTFSMFSLIGIIILTMILSEVCYDYIKKIGDDRK